MTIDPDKLFSWPFKMIEQTYTVRDAIIYALGIGFGYDPIDEGQLDFLFEEREFMAVPTMAAVLCAPGFWVRNPESGIDWEKVLHGEQTVELHQPLPPKAKINACTRITDIIDKGEGKGALLFSERTLVDSETGNPLATLRSTTFARGDGGFGGTLRPQPQPYVVPDNEPDMICDLPTLPQAALIYRLSGDLNPLHADPKLAPVAGFDRPILHGLCTLGVAGHAILKTYCDYDANRFKCLSLRFSAPVYPGETIRTEMWRNGNNVSFRAKVVERDTVVLNNGFSVISEN